MDAPHTTHSFYCFFWCTCACTREMLRGARIVMHLGDVVILGSERRNLCRRVVCSVSCEKKLWSHIRAIYVYFFTFCFFRFFLITITHIGRFCSDVAQSWFLVFSENEVQIADLGIVIFITPRTSPAVSRLFTKCLERLSMECHDISNFRIPAPRGSLLTDEIWHKLSGSI